MDVSGLIMETLLDTGECLQLRLLLSDPGELVSEPGPGHQQTGQGDQGGQGGQRQQHQGQRDQHQPRLPGQTRVECREELSQARGMSLL